MGSRGGALKSVANQPTLTGNFREECEPCRTLTFVSPAVSLLLLLLHVSLNWTLSQMISVQGICGSITGGLEDIRTRGIPLCSTPSSKIFLMYCLSSLCITDFQKHFTFSQVKVTSDKMLVFLGCFLTHFLHPVLMNHHHPTFRPEFLPHVFQQLGTAAANYFGSRKRINIVFCLCRYSDQKAIPPNTQHCISACGISFQPVSTCSHMHMWQRVVI